MQSEHGISGLMNKGNHYEHPRLSRRKGHPMRPVIVTWMDALTPKHMDWEALDSEPMVAQPVRTIGFLRRDDATEVELVMSYGGDEMAGRWTVPRCCVVAVEYLVSQNLSMEGPMG